jgi:hypothetical protein
MDSSMVQVPASKTSSFWTDEKHVNYLNTMEASFVRKMFENKNCCCCSSSSSNHNRMIPTIDHHRQILRLDRNLPDSSESTLDLKPHQRRRTRKYHAPSGIRSFFFSYGSVWFANYVIFNIIIIIIIGGVMP